MNSLMHASEPLTTKDFFALDVDEKLKVELIGGAYIVSPSPKPWHGLVANALFIALMDALRPDNLIFLDLDVIIDDETVVRPDIFVVPKHTYGPDDVAVAANVVLAVEIVSPGSRFRDRRIKPGLYQAAGIASWRIDYNDKRLCLTEVPVRGEEQIHLGSSTLQVGGIDVAIDLDAIASEVFGG